MTGPGPLARTEGLKTQTLDGEVLVYDLDCDVAIHLNQTAALVWRSCDGRRTVADLSNLVATQLGEPADTDVVLMALDNLLEHGLISSGYAERDGAAVALSRRRFFRRFGVAGAAALNAPVVYSLLVPIASAAQSSGNSGNDAFNTQPDQFSRSLRSGSGNGDDDESDDGSAPSGSGSSDDDDDASYP